MIIAVKEEDMSSAFVREGETPQVFTSRESAESAAKLNASMDAEHTYEVRTRNRGGYMVARLDKAGNFQGWVSD